MGTNGEIAAATAFSGDYKIAKDANSYAYSDTNKGVFLNPANASGNTATLANKPANMSTANSQSAALTNTPGSLGMAVFYERDVGQSKELVYSMDSAAVTLAYGVYNAEVTAFNSAKTTYDTKKKEYEDAVTASKKEPKTVIPTRPDMPSPPSAYAGPKLLLATQNVDTVGTNDVWSGTWKTGTTKTKNDMLLATDWVAGDATNEWREYGFTQTNVKDTFHNRIGYLVMSATNL